MAQSGAFYFRLTHQIKTSSSRKSNVVIVQKLNSFDSGTLYVARESKTNNDLEHLIKRSQYKDEDTEKTFKCVLDKQFLAQMIYLFKVPDITFLVMEYYEKGDLLQFIEQNHRLTLAGARIFAAELYLALEYLRSKEIIHRDLKPDNIFVDKTGHIVVGDFDLACFKDRHQLVYVKCGTLNYMAPEVARAFTDGYSFTADYWSFGCVLFEMITGRNLVEHSRRIMHRSNNELEFMIQYIDLDIQDNVIEENTDLYDFVVHLCKRDAEQRLGHRSITEIRNHRFFNSLDWNLVKGKKYKLFELWKPEMKIDESPTTTQEYVFSEKDCDYNGLGRSHSSQVNEFFERHSLQSKRNFAEFSEPQLKLCCYSKELDSYMEMPLNKLEEYTKRMMPSFAPPRSNNNVLSDESDSNE